MNRDVKLHISKKTLNLIDLLSDLFELSRYNLLQFAIQDFWLDNKAKSFEKFQRKKNREQKLPLAKNALSTRISDYLLGEIKKWIEPSNLSLVEALSLMVKWQVQSWFPDRRRPSRLCLSSIFLFRVPKVNPPIKKRIIVPKYITDAIQAELELGPFIREAFNYVYAGLIRTAIKSENYLLDSPPTGNQKLTLNLFEDHETEDVLRALDTIHFRWGEWTGRLFSNVSRGLFVEGDSFDKSSLEAESKLAKFFKFIEANKYVIK